MSVYSSRGPTVRNKSEKRNNAKQSIKKGEEIKENYNRTHMGQDERDYREYIEYDNKKRKDSKLNKTARRRLGSMKYNARHYVVDDDLPSPSIYDLYGDLPTQDELKSVSPSPPRTSQSYSQSQSQSSTPKYTSDEYVDELARLKLGGGFRKKSNKNRRSRSVRTRSRRGVRKQK